jgi:hypothetical protein
VRGVYGPTPYVRLVVASFFSTAVPPLERPI